MSAFFLFWDRVLKRRIGLQSAERESTDSERHLIPKDEDEKDSERPQASGRRAVHLAAAVIALFFWSLFTFAVGLKAANVWHQSEWGTFERGFVEERVVSE
jgi:hypothetical protein